MAMLPMAEEAGALQPDWLRRALAGLHRLQRLPEPLERSAPLALDWAERYCGRCRAYHGLWQYRRLTGGVSALRADGQIYQALIAQLAKEQGARRVLIAASADYAQQAVVLDAFRGIGAGEAAAQILMVDRCATPLRLNAWLAEERGGRLETRQGDLLTVDLGEGHDLILSHSLFYWFTGEERVRLLRRWFAALRPGGRVLLSNRVRAAGSQILPDERTSTAALVREIEGARDRLPAEVVPRLLELAPSLYGTWAHHPVEGLVALTGPFVAAGFELEAVLVPQDLLETVTDGNSVPGKVDTARRHLVVARRPR